MQGIVFNAKTYTKTSDVLIKTLARPYPKITPGIPNRITMTEKRFTYTFFLDNTTKKLLEISTPTINYPDGYTIHVYVNNTQKSSYSQKNVNTFIMDTTNLGNTNDEVKIISKRKTFSSANRR